MIRRIAGVAAGMAMIAGLAGTAAAGVAIVDGVRTEPGDGREWSSPGGSIFTVNYGASVANSADGRRVSFPEQTVRDQ